MGVLLDSTNPLLVHLASLLYRILLCNQDNKMEGLIKHFLVNGNATLLDRVWEGLGARMLSREGMEEMARWTLDFIGRIRILNLIS